MVRLSKAIDLFLLRCRLLGLTKKTIEGYDDYLNRFARYSGDIEICDLNMEIVNNYTLCLMDKNLSSATVASYIRQLKAFVNWLGKEGHIKPFAEKITVPKSAKKVVKIYTDVEIQQMFNTLDADPKWIYYRNRCIIALMLDSGLRQSETCYISMEDINFSDSLLKVHGKGNKERIVPLGTSTTHFIYKYLNECPFKPSERLFLCRDGAPITNNTVKLFVSKLSKRLPFSVSSHKLRHNFATNYCLDQYEKNGHIDIYQLMILMGHEDTLTTRRYLHLANQLIASKFNISHLDKVFSWTPFYT